MLTLKKLENLLILGTLGLIYRAEVDCVLLIHRQTKLCNIIKGQKLALSRCHRATMIIIRWHFVSLLLTYYLKPQ